MFSNTLESAERVITHLDKMEDSLTQIEQELGALDELMERFPLPLILGDGEDWTYVSKSFATHLGWSREDIQTRPLEWFIHPEDRSATDAEMQRVLRDQNQGHIVNRFRTKDGGYRRMLWHWSPPGPRSGLTWMLGQAQEEV